jgi:hypothetical protein
MYGHLAIGAGGALEMIYPRPVGVVGAADAIFHVRSTDGGATFGLPVKIVAAGRETTLELPTVAARPNGDLLVCWGQGALGGGRILPGYSEVPARFRTDEHANQVRCAEKRAAHEWAPGQPALDLLAGTTPGWPTIAGTADGWYLLLYLADSKGTEVALFRSHGGPFVKVATLATAPGLGPDRVCFSAVTSCARTQSDTFRPGDIVGLAAQGGRLAAAYVLPRPGKPLVGSGALYVSVVDEPGRD